VADDLRHIAQLEADARAAVQAGAPRERVEAILAEIERLKAHVAELEQRLRQAINDVLTDEQRTCLATAARKP
jgi:HAMP domain-containing protein